MNETCRECGYMDRDCAFFCWIPIPDYISWGHRDRYRRVKIKLADETGKCPDWISSYEERKAWK